MNTQRLPFQHNLFKATSKIYGMWCDATGINQKILETVYKTVNAVHRFSSCFTYAYSENRPYKGFSLQYNNKNFFCAIWTVGKFFKTLYIVK